jgi:formylglycine-generating enzyme required for sulfatase activity
MRHTVLLVLTLALCLAVGAGAPAASQESRVALVIGNAAYEHTAHLPNPVNDASDIAASLSKLRYSVQLLTDASKAGIETALARFARSAAGADIAVIYYAGHGLESNGVNYLLPVEARVDSESTVPLEAVSLPTVMGVAANARHLGLVVLDACRNNPLAIHIIRPGEARSTARGLAAVEPAGSKLLVAYATRDGHVATDGTGRNSPYTAAILEELQVQGLEVRVFWGRVHDRVLSATRNGQEPFIYGALGGEQLYLNPQLPATPPPPGYDPVEVGIWQSALKLGTADAYRDYLARYPAGQFNTQAQLQIAALRRQGPGPPVSPTPQEAPPQEGVAGRTFRDCPECPEMVSIAAGHFLMGSPKDKSYYDEVPQHPVELPAFMLGKYAVTFEQWDACTAAGGCSKNPGDSGWGRGSRPVINVTWDDAQQYVRWLSRRTGHRYRLPSEAEWEYAARAGTTTAYYWGDDFSKGRCAGCSAPYHGSKTAPAGSFAPNPWGLYDMVGEVWQWTQDPYHKDYSGAPADGRSWETGGEARVLRGGAWYGEDSHVAMQTRSAYRYHDSASGDIIGMRVAMTP